MTRPSPRLSLRLAAGAAAAAMLCASLGTPAQADTNLGKLSDYVKNLKSEAGTSAVPNKWFVQVSGAPTDDGGNAATARNNRDSVIRNAKSRGLKIEVTRQYDTSFNGLTINASDASVAELLSIPGVEKVFPVVQVHRPVVKGGGTEPNMVAALNLSGASVAQNELGLTGQGIKIGILDTGIDIDHPDFGGNGTNGSTRFPTKKVTHGYDFVGDDYDASVPGARPVPDQNPDDCEGHGTHVAGIASADGNTAANGIKGVAPKATLGAYRVFGCEGSTDSDIILAALEQAGKDKMNVVNMSLGFSYMSWPDYPTAQAADRLHKKGVVVVASAGNEGAGGLFSTGAPSVANTAISVASFENSLITQNVFRTSDGRTTGYVNASGAPIAPKSGTLTLNVPNPLLACAPLPPVARDTVLLIQRGTCSFHEKALAAQQAGAAAVVLFNNAPGTINPTVEGDRPITIPVVMISQADGEALAAAAGAGNVTLTWTADVASTPNAEAGLISDFSSWGLAADLTLKPDLGAPGGNIWSTVPLEKGGHASNSGTSMSAPHVAGVVALLLQARPDLRKKPTEVRELLQNTATPATFSDIPGAGTELVARQGAGMVNILRAATTRQSVTPGKISLGEAGKRPVTTTLTIENDAPFAVTYTISNHDAIGAIVPSNPEFYLAPATFSTNKTTVKVKARGSAKVKVTISAPEGAPDGYIYGGYVTITGDNGSTLRVPYAGMAGDYQAVQAMDPFGLCYLDGDTYRAAAPGHNFTMQGTNIPYVLFHLEYPVQQMELWAYKANADGSKGALLSPQAVVQTGNAGRDNSYSGLGWDGTYRVNKKKNSPVANAPAGSYILEVKVLKALGNAKDASHWESFSTVPFTIGSAGKVDPSSTKVDLKVDPNAKAVVKPRS
ncbi:S8 family serine peptidase [Propionibacteriaceae bacterium Y1923]|uniref:S8 family serine peptidase n=1 Tax=Aestuariimicrobium sp. Y1814 TaxID=3418742 RepID=UPI003C1421DB